MPHSTLWLIHVSSGRPVSETSHPIPALRSRWTVSSARAADSSIDSEASFRGLEKAIIDECVTHALGTTIAIEARAGRCFSEMYIDAIRSVNFITLRACSTKCTPPTLFNGFGVHEVLHAYVTEILMGSYPTLHGQSHHEWTRIPVEHPVGSSFDSEACDELSLTEG